MAEIYKMKILRIIFCIPIMICMIIVVTKVFLHSILFPKNFKKWEEMYGWDR